MTATWLSGTKIAKEIRESLRPEIERLTKAGVQPGLAVVLVGDDPASQVYVNKKAKTCLELGMHSEVYRLPAETEEAELLGLIDRLNRDDRIHGILVQLPLPKHIKEKNVIDAIHPSKDVDGFHPVNVGNLAIGDDCLLPCTPAGVIEMLKRGGIEIAGKHAVVVGRSNIVGKPVALLLLREHATVTITHSRTPDLASITRQADILVVAAGKPELIDRTYVKPGAVVVDVGIHRREDGTLCGDVKADDVAETAGVLTPVPGGVGPMTIVMLMKNTVEAAGRALASGKAGRG
ncbi:bifunctional methylenetetrahydrofolate dehydrogenase/methenyltetrahydrofolate cyclohydrolase FolD [Paenibacillus thermoaerophilus]|uniref:Bifunctional protein FolD n=1 Tax=Paenibacillus thermoaerophilus TaxID=1215385 RepID=A0ABW2V7V2_9BACL|nr:bifunctional methylenetetrahydrofolate dehydrogenase/methenyltetrahydrofolate cyclohydrolase FolD [Paenibacillus thermoaerophilus]TMV18780.1 bifunctional methylenetetrahydrofolate dehydrogenase/methenyltetrahydrofolate cyclohydrolase FolD [Paenibacillus thermoaerophilus]